VFAQKTFFLSFCHARDSILFLGGKHLQGSFQRFVHIHAIQDVGKIFKDVLAALKEGVMLSLCCCTGVASATTVSSSRE
jgi:hypothetical protein